MKDAATAGDLLARYKQSAHESLQACLENIQEAKDRKEQLEDLMERLPPGDIQIVGRKYDKVTRQPEILPLSYRICKAAFEIEHWKEYANHYRRVIAKQQSGK